MKRLYIILVGLASLLSCGANLHAQSPRVLSRAFEATDSNGDGRLDQGEVEESQFRFLHRDFDRLDKDSNGEIDRKELEGYTFQEAGRRPANLANRPTDLVEAVVRVLERVNYRGIKIDDETSLRMHETFLDALDPMKLYFLQSDVNEFQTYKSQHDDLLKQSDVSAAIAIYKRLRERSAERIEWALEFAAADFDFEKVDSRPVTPEASEYATDDKSAKERWRKEVKFQLAQLIASGADESKARKRVRTKHEMLPQNENKPTVTARYLNALANSMDPHSEFRPPDNAKRVNQEMSQSLVGIGVLLKNGDMGPEIVSLTPGGPAEESGKLSSGDRILSVGQGHDGELADVSSSRVWDVAQLIKGKADSTVRLEVENSSGQAVIIELVRRKVDLPGVTTQLVESGSTDSDIKIGLIRIPSFYYLGKSVSKDTAQALDELIEAEVDAVLIDLRNNSGGSLDEAVNIAGLFIDGPVVTTKNQRGFIRDMNDDDDGVAYDGPLALVLNRRSASASEILAAAIQDYRRGVLIGDSQTFGKGSSATRIDVARFLRRSNEELGVLDATGGKFYRPTGESTLLEGVKSNIVLPSLTDDPMIGEAAMDYVLARDSIEPSKFTLTDFVTKEVVRELNQRS